MDVEAGGARVFVCAGVLRAKKERESWRRCRNGRTGHREGLLLGSAISTLGRFPGELLENFKQL